MTKKINLSDLEADAENLDSSVYAVYLKNIKHHGFFLNLNSQDIIKRSELIEQVQKIDMVQTGKIFGIDPDSSTPKGRENPWFKFAQWGMFGNNNPTVTLEDNYDSTSDSDFNPDSNLELSSTLSYDK